MKYATLRKRVQVLLGRQRTDVITFRILEREDGIFSCRWTCEAPVGGNPENVNDLEVTQNSTQLSPSPLPEHTVLN